MYGPEPEFVGDIQSIKVIAGKDAILKCVVKNLGEHKVVWRMVNNKNFLSMGAHTVEKDDRIQVTSVNSTSWYLHIKNVTQNDSGYYACQISTSPVKSQAGYLDVVEPPEFVTNMTDRNVTVMENSNVTLFCKATGNPPPVIKWKREDEQPFLVGHDLIREYESEELRLTSVSRKHMAAYLCLASNEVPPAISRRIYLDVKFGPLIWIHNQLVGAQESTNISLECHTEAHPTSENFWLRNGEPFVSKSSRYQTHIERNSYETHMKLTIRNLQPEDYGSYQCVAKNAISETEGSIKLFKTVIPTPSPPKPVTEGMPTFPTRKVITVAVTTDHRSIFNDLERRENTNAPVKQQKYGDGRVSPDGENSVLRTDANAVIYILVCLLSLWWGSSYKCCR